MTAAGTAFDRFAATYDVLWNKTAIGISQRRAVWRHLDALVHPGGVILDLGCGTGEDAIYFKSRGAQVYAIDASAAMAGVARDRGVNAQQRTVEEIADLEGRFNGVISNFGVLNCVADLAAVGSQLKRLVVPGGFAAICVMSPFCLRETLHFLKIGKVKYAFRRLTRGKTRFSLGIEIRYPSFAQLTRVFRDGFNLVGWYGVGLCVPPSYIRGIGDATIHRLSRLDRRLAHLPGLRAIADHRLFLFKRL